MDLRDYEAARIEDLSRRILRVIDILNPMGSGGIPPTHEAIDEALAVLRNDAPGDDAGEETR